MKRVTDRPVKRGVHPSTARYFAVAVAALALLLVISFSVGRYPVSANELLRLLWFKVLGTPSGLPETVETVVFKVRGPRVLASMMVGGALAVSGAVYQGLFRNPLVSPDILGVSSGCRARRRSRHVIFHLGFSASRRWRLPADSLQWQRST